MKISHPIFLLLLVASLLCGNQIHSQVTGNVADSTGIPVLFGNVMLLKASDSTVVTGTSTDEAGNFTLEKKDTGTFCLLVLYTGYQKYYSYTFTLSETQPKYDAGKIILHADTSLLDAVQIVAQKPFMEQKLDRLVFNIENSVIAAGNNGLEVLKKLPGVTVDNNDNIQVRGKSGVLFMINGRTSHLSGADMASYLRSIDASQIEKIEVITNPSAKYDASGNAIINIVLRKNKNLGFNGQVNAGGNQGFYGASNAGLELNHRTKKWNFHSTGNLYNHQYYEAATRLTSFNSNEYIHANSRVKYHGLWNYAQAGVDFSPNDKQTIGFSAERSGGNGTQQRFYHSGMYDANGTLDSSQVTRGLQTDEMAFYTFDLNYKLTIDTTGKELSVDVNYAPFTTIATRENKTDFYNSANQLYRSATQKAYLPIRVNILAGQLDYTHPVGQKIRIETGVKGSVVATDNNARYFNIEQGEEISDTTLTNHFLYDENIFSAYVNYAQELNAKLSFQVGFRGEQTQTKGTQLVNDSVFTRSYFNLFPSTFLTWKTDSINSFNLSYSRRIDRPGYGQLNPFLLFLNPYTYNSGNPYLRPQMSDNFELTHIFHDMLNTTFGYAHMTNIYSTVTRADSATNIFYNRNENLNTYNVFSLSSSLTYPITNWLTTVTTLTGFRDHYFGIVNEENFSAVRYTWILNSLNMITLKKAWSMDVSFFYRSFNQNGVWLEAPVYNMDLGVRKKFPNGKGSVSFVFSDIFRSSYQNSKAVYPSYTFAANGKADSRRVGISVSYKLGKSQYQRDRKAKSAQQELNRAK